jgi:hypothetical protein
MKNRSVGPMYIYVSGPYSPPPTLSDAAEKAKAIEDNIKKADEYAREIIKKGHIPFTPHTMMKGWEDVHNISREAALDISFKWLEKCDALFFIAPSKGADDERSHAVQLNLPVYRNLEDIPEVTQDLPSKLSATAINAYLDEYKECADSYRHTYTTIWAAGSIFAAISAGIIAFTKSSNPTESIPLWIQFLAPIPFLFWYQGIFRPMNRYGELRSDRLERIEQILSNAVPDLDMNHFTLFNQRKKGGLWPRIKRFEWLWKPRVSEIVTLFSTALIIFELYLIGRWLRP